MLASKHLSWAELACKDGTPYPEKWRDSRAVELSILFEKIRSLCGGKPIKVLSAYRTVSHNKSIGGAIKSQHLEGRALDLLPPKGMNVTAFWNIISSHRAFLRLGGIGRYKTFVHVDIRPTDRVAIWSGSGVKDANS